jgi:DNA modification methylase
MALIEQSITDDYALYNGDCCEVVADLPTASIDHSIYSPPFCGLYNYSSDDRDMSNSASYEAFFRHYEFLVREMARVTKPGRINAIHCMDIPNPGQRDGYFDLPGAIIALHVKHGFDFFGRITIWKEPLSVAIRTRLKHLTHKQLVKDSTESTVAAGDCLLILKRCGANKVPVTHVGGFQEYAGARQVPEELLQYKGLLDQRENKLSHWIWRQYASCVWDDIRVNNVLPYKAAREPEDEKHVHPLQLDVITRSVTLWSNPGETVLTPFMGVGSEVYGAVYNGRRGVGVELKSSYYKQAVKNVARAKSDAAQAAVSGTIFAYANEVEDLSADNPAEADSA